MELIQKIIDKHGVLGKVFIIQALQHYAGSILNADPRFMQNQMANGSVSWEEWHNLTQEVLNSTLKEPFPDLNKKD